MKNYSLNYSLAGPSFMGAPVQWTQVTPYAEARDWFVDAIRYVGEIGKLQANWDTYGSPAVTRLAKEQAIRILLQLSRHALPEPQVGPVSGGGVQFEWNIGPRSLELEVLPDGRIEFLRMYEDDRRSEEHTSELQSRSDLVC